MSKYILLFLFLSIVESYAIVRNCYYEYSYTIHYDTKKEEEEIDRLTKEKIDTCIQKKLKKINFFTCWTGGDESGSKKVCANKLRECAKELEIENFKVLKADIKFDGLTDEDVKLLKNK